MTRLHWILLLAALATWVPAYVWFFHHDVSHWWRVRGEARQQARAAEAEQRAAQARLREELAAKYLPPDARGDQPG